MMNQDSTSNKPSLAKLTKNEKKKQEKENLIQAKEKSS